MAIVGECSTAQEAQILYSQTQPDAVIIDHRLPDSSGLKLAEALLTQDIYARIVLLIPARMATDSQNLIAQGVKAVVTKPFYPELLQSTLIEVVVGL